MSKTNVFEVDKQVHEPVHEPVVTVEVPRPEVGYSFHVELVDSYCRAPDCPCNSAVMRPCGVSGRGVEEIAKELAELDNSSIFVDLGTGEVKAAGESPSELIVCIAEALKHDLDEELLECLSSRYAESKARGREEAAWRDKDWSGLEFGDTLAWSELFPSDGYFSAGAKSKYLVADQYCWDPTCQCDQAVLSLAELVGDDYVTCGSFYYNLKSKRAKPVSSPTKQSSKSVLQKFLATEPGIHDTLQFRYDYIKNEFGLRLQSQRLNAKVAPRSQKVGRNQPCPCGSGKKYKKCCL